MSSPVFEKDSVALNPGVRGREKEGVVGNEL